MLFVPPNPVIPPASFPNITISMWEYVITVCEIYKNNFLSFNNVTYNNFTIIYW